MLTNFVTPKLYIWPNQMLLLGVRPVSYRTHMTVSDKLIVSIDGDIKVTLSEGTEVNTRSCLVKAGGVFEDESVDVSAAVVAIYYLAPLTQDSPCLEHQMFFATEGVYYAHPREMELVNTLLEIRAGNFAPASAYSLVREFIVPPELSRAIFIEFDKRVVKVLERIRETVRENLNVQDFATEVNISESRLEKLFKEQIGVPITKYRLRYRVFISILHLAQGESITDAALYAGFSSTAHFSKSFSSINGIPPSEAFLKPPVMDVYLSYEAAELVAGSNARVNYG